MLTSTAGAAEYLGGRLGEFQEVGKHGGRPFFAQRETEGTQPQNLYFEDNCWQISVTLGNRNDYVKNCQNTQLPPTRNWEYAKDGGWSDDDTSLTLEFTTLSPICQLVRVAGEGDVVEKQGSSLGDYRSVYFSVLNITESKTSSKQLIAHRLEEGRWGAGRPVFKKVGGESRFLQVDKWTHNWTIRTSTTGGPAWIQSGRATNSPASPEAGASVREGVTRWRYFDGNSWKEGDIGVTCL